MANELILLVEDNDKNRKLVRDVLHFKGIAWPRPKPVKKASD
jgi:CheY-like chemotaxis protein